jgi:hypothetical protein
MARESFTEFHGFFFNGFWHIGYPFFKPLPELGMKIDKNILLNA